MWPTPSSGYHERRRVRRVTPFLCPILVGEVNAGFRPSGHPINWRDPSDGLGGGPRAFGGPPASTGVHFLMADGSVRSLSPRTDPAVLRALATPAGGEEVPP